VAKVVPVKGGYEIRVYTSYASAVAGGLHTKTAKTVFKKKHLCDGKCLTNFSRDSLYVVCTDQDCVSPDCECHLIEMWTDKNGWHEINRGYPGEGWEYVKKTNGVFACRRSLKPIASAAM
jgi:hypothetical protein